MISWVSKTDVAEWVHLPLLRSAIFTHDELPSSYFYTEFKCFVPSNPPIAYIPSAKLAAARALLWIFSDGTLYHFYALISYIYTDFKG